MLLKLIPVKASPFLGARAYESLGIFRVFPREYALHRGVSNKGSPSALFQGPRVPGYGMTLTSFDQLPPMLRARKDARTKKTRLIEARITNAKSTSSCARETWTLKVKPREPQGGG